MTDKNTALGDTFEKAMTLVETAPKCSITITNGVRKEVHRFSRSAKVGDPCHCGMTTATEQDL